MKKTWANRHMGGRTHADTRTASQHVDSGPVSDRPPHHRLRGGDLPRGCSNPACGHAGRAGHQLYMAIAFSVILVGQMLGFFPPLSAHVAHAETQHIAMAGAFRHMQIYDAEGNFVRTGNDPAYFADDAGNQYFCVNPSILFIEGSFTENNIYDHFSTDVVHECALAICWSQQNSSPEDADYVAQAFIWRILRAAGYYSSLQDTIWVVDGHNTNAAWKEFEKWFEQNKGSYDTGGSYWTNGDSQQVANFWFKKSTGKAKLYKTSSDSSVSANNQLYSLAGARYGIYRDELCTTKLDAGYDLVTNEKGESNTVELDKGTYWIKEITAPEGFIVDEKAHQVVIKANSTSKIELSDKPLYEGPSVWANKYDVQLGDTPQGDASLADAEFTVRYFAGNYTSTTLPSHATRTWVLKTDSKGQLIPGEKNKVSGDDFYTNKDGAIIFPLGTVAIQETKAPRGYWLEGQGPASPSGYTAPVHLAHITGSGDFSCPSIGEEIMRGGLSLGKIDRELEIATAQGEATLKGAAFAITLASDNPVSIDGVTYKPGQVVQTITTDNKGFAVTGARDLPYATYVVTESAAPEGYLLNSDFSKQVEIRTDGVVKSLGSKICEDRVIRGALSVGKISRETGQHLSQGEASLAGAEFEVTLTSKTPVLVGGTLRNQGDVVCTLVTNANGIASTKDRLLPYATYRVKEVKAPKGYLLNDTWSKTFSIRTDGETCDFTNEADSADDQVMRGGFHINKVDETSMERMAGLVFSITSATTGESHIAVSDENGILITEDEPHTHKTNANDKAVDENGKVDEDKIVAGAGIWFNGRADVQTEPSDSFAALPYDTYIVQELATSANEGYELVNFTVRVHKHDVIVDMGTVDDKRIEEPAIATTLMYEGVSHEAPANSVVTLTDTVAYSGLTPGTTYTLYGMLINHATGDVFVDGQGQEIRASTSFTPAISAGAVSLDFIVDTTGMENTTLVAFEHLFEGETEVTSHEDLEDQEQTLRIPSVGTQLAVEDSDDSQELPQTLTLVDTVSYGNVEAGERYQLEGTLMDAETGSAFCDKDGNKMTATGTFVAEDTAGTAQVRFELSRAVAEGHTLVAFESLLRGGIVVAKHEDIADANQTVAIPSIATTLTDSDGNTTVDATKTIELVDTVTYRGLTPGQSYTVEGTLIDKDSGEAILDSKGKEIKSTGTFTPESAEGTTTVTFVCDASLLCGRTVVAYETLIFEDRAIAVHADLEDEAQTIYVPEVGTTLTDRDGAHETTALGKTVLVDTVSYKGVAAGTSLIIDGSLMDAQTGAAVTDKDGKPITGTTSFVSESTNGTAAIEFSFDARSIAGHNIVAFETLSEVKDDNPRVLAKHEDLKSQDQTVSLPKIATTATDAADGDKNIQEAKKARVVDEVSYENLKPGIEYVMHATLYDKKTGREVLQADGKAVSSEVKFTPREPSGKVRVEMTFDTGLVQGSEVVAFESCTHGDREIATHADISDKGQTVTIIRKPQKEEEDKKKEEKEKQPVESRSSGTRTPATGDTTRSALGILVLSAAALAYGVYMRRQHN